MAALAITAGLAFAAVFATHVFDRLTWLDTNADSIVTKTISNLIASNSALSNTPTGNVSIDIANTRQLLQQYVNQERANAGQTPLS
jgi:hypothetical protein